MMSKILVFREEILVSICITEMTKVMIPPQMLKEFIIVQKPENPLIFSYFFHKTYYDNEILTKLVDKQVKSI